MDRPAPRALEPLRPGVRVLQQQQSDERRRSGAGRSAALAEAARPRQRSYCLMRVLAVTHGPLVGPELFADVLAEDGHELREWEIAKSGAPPADGYDAVLVFGGKQNVGEERDYPWLHHEYTAIKRWTEDGTPLLGVCLGAQTLAHAPVSYTHLTLPTIYS